MVRSTVNVGRTNGYTHFLALGVFVAFGLLVHIALRIAGLCSERCLDEHEELLIFWSCAFSGLYAASTCPRNWEQLTCKGIRVADAVPDPLVGTCISGLWSLASQLPRWCVFERRPRTYWQLLAAVTLAACALLALVSTYMLLSTPCGLHVDKATIWFALGCLVSAQAVAGQIIRFFHAGGCTGFRVVAGPLIMVLSCLGASVVHNADDWSALCWACSALFACAVVCGGIATHLPEEICSNSVLFERARSSNLTSGVCGTFRSVKRYTKTWRGTLMMCAVNSTISAWVYRPWTGQSYTDHYVSRLPHRGTFDTLHIASPETSCCIIFVLATLSFGTSVVSILSDRCRQDKKLQGGTFPTLPMDRHFRGVTALKIGMIIVKTDFLMTYGNADAHEVPTILQVVSIALTVVCANWSVIRMLQSALDISHEFSGMFRYPVTLWRASITCLFVWHAMNAMLLLLAVFDVLDIEHVLGVAIPSPQHVSWLGVLLPVGTQWLYMGNELALVLSSKVSNPRVFAAVQSRQGTVIVATCGAVGIPMTMICKVIMWLLHCRNRKLGLHGDIAWETYICFAVSITFVCGG
eukprot:CAMPEP_0198524426 /NCGR_PEP_ID=MMETSP1462-20131121/22736_1 /TAXON_ID=1333877 /ORGANISM="Brandtodinium nutriculum, Strain RCC3387" /LENGTH=579 /DNA_ID=CAMNT_0044254153 /DNA_START=106 /DNA_END=1842 /DNA_ORIENTATION=+